MSSTQIVLIYIVSNITAVTFLIITLYSTRLARMLFAGLFIGAGFLNWIVVHTNPDHYLNYSKYAVGMYRDLIVGPFQNYIVPMVSFMAVCQVFIGLGLLYKGTILRASCIVGGIFLVAISPLGIATAFPSGLIWAVGLYAIYRDPFEANIFLKMKWTV